MAHYRGPGNSQTGRTELRGSGQALLEAQQPNRAAVIDELEDRYSERFPDLAEFVGAFSALSFTDDFTQQKRAVQYVLKRIYEYGSKTTNIDPSRMTIEHLAPQSDKTLTRIGELGNLIWVPETLNLDLGSKSFKEKQKILATANGVWVPPEILQASAWRDAEIEARTLEMAENSYTDIWMIN